MDALISLSAKSEAAVEVMEVSGDWYVLVVDARGKEMIRTFLRESFAISYAEHQRIRLGLGKFDRL